MFLVGKQTELLLNTDIVNVIKRNLLRVENID